MSGLRTQSAHKPAHKLPRLRGHHDATRLTRKGGIYFYRRRLPGTLGHEISMSLGTRQFRRAEWIAASLEAKFLSIARKPGVTREEIQALLHILLERILDDDEQARVHLREPGYPVHASKFDVEDSDGDLAKADEKAALADKELWVGALAEGDYSVVSDTVDELLDGQEVPTEDRRFLAHGVLEVFVKAAEIKAGRSRGAAFSVFDAEPGPALPLPRLLAAKSGSEPQAAPPKPLASTLVEPFFEKRKAINKTSSQVMSQERDTLKLFLEICSDRPVDCYNRGDITLFHDTIRKLPTIRGRSPRDKELKVQDFIARAVASGEKTIDGKTLKRHHSALSQFFRFSVDRGLLTHLRRVELTDGFTFETAKRARDQRAAWTSDELKTLFASPVWGGCAGPTSRNVAGSMTIRDARFWLPILGAYQGARLEELADLYRRDISCEQGIWVVRIQESQDNDDAGDRTVKTPSAIRTLPLHPELIRLGFLEYVGSKAPNPGDPLFPDLEPQGPDKKRGPRITRWFVTYRKHVGVYRSGVAMHAFRHAARTRLADVTDNSQDRILDALFGHAPSGSQGATRYDKGPGLKACAETLALLTYPEIDLS